MKKAYTFSSSWASGRNEAGSEHIRKNSWKAGEKISGLRSWGHLSPGRSVESAKGGAACANSQTVAPTDHISALKALYGSPALTSGAYKTQGVNFSDTIVE